MTVTLHDPQQIGANVWRLTWESDVSDPLYRVYLNGELFRETRSPCLQLPVDAAIGADLEVRDDATPPALVADKAPTIRWDAVANAREYVIHEYVDSAWVQRGVVYGNDRRQWHTTPMAGGVDHLFRITPIGENGNSGTPTQMTLNVPRTPAPPVVAWDYDDSTHTLTISSAA